MMENLIDWSRTQGENIKFLPEHIDLHSLALNVVTLLEINAYSKGIDLTSDIMKNCMVYADKTLISSVLRNLIDNALKYTSKEGKIIISAIPKADMVEISVSDTGIGMSDSMVSRIFRIDSNVSTEGTAREKGTGLGLMICRDFVEMHGGRIWAESQKGKGTTFTFSLPIRPTETANS